MNKRLWYINAALAAVLVITWIGAIAGLPGYPSSAVFDKGAYSTGSDTGVGNQDAESQTITAARGFSNWLDPPPAYGSVKVTIEPAEVLSAGGGWRVGGSEWLESGVLAESITPGEKNISFKDIKGWVTPAVNAVVEKDKTTEITATYTIPPRGFVKVSIQPEQVVALSAQWMIDEGQWLNSGDTSQVTNVGDYGLSFTAIEGWDSPVVTVSIEDQKTKEVTAEYVLIRYGNINVVAGEGVKQPEGTGWKFQGENWLTYGVEPQKARLGSYEVSFKDVADWNKPANITVNMEEEKTYDVVAAYTPIPYAQVTTRIKPENDQRLSTAQWRVDEGEWLNFGATNSKVIMGQHVISFKPVEGWQPVGGQAIEITEEKGYDFSCVYERIRPAAPTFVIRSVIETGGGKGVAFTSAQQGYKVGEEIDGFRLLHVAEGKVVLEKEGFEYEVVVAENSQLVAPNGSVMPGQPMPGQPMPGQPMPGRPEGMRPPIPMPRP